MKDHKPTLPKVEKWLNHEQSHGNWTYSSGQGHQCLELSCEINQNPRSVLPILNFLERNQK